MQTSSSILSLQGRAEEELLQAKQVLEIRTEELDSYSSLLAATLESTPDGIVALDLAGKVITYNTTFTDIWHFPADILQRRNSREMMAYAAQQMDDPDAFLQLIQKRQAEPHQTSFDVVRMQNGRTFERYGFPQRVNNECVGVVVNFREITDRVLAE